ncbi:MAG: synthase gamma chain [Patescibacteria group bacterium]|nr:synthase gamma chain [Patescibacteria group bacterium]
MAGLKAIKSKIRSIEKTETVTKAMEAVSAAKMRKAQLTALNGRAYAKAAVSILARVSGSDVLKNHPLTRNTEGVAAPALYIVITSDKGLAGGLNSAVLRAVQNDIRESGLQPSDVSIVAVGKKANDFFSARGFTIVLYRPNTQELDATLISEILARAADAFSQGTVGIVKIAYQNFISTFEQRPTVRTIFPLTLSELEAVVGDITPKRGAFAEAESPMQAAPYTIEPSEAQVFDTILPKLASIFVYHALLESQASEHSARMVAMKSASDKASELEHSLTLQFNKARQAAITREVSEITGGMEAMASK